MVNPDFTQVQKDQPVNMGGAIKGNLGDLAPKSDYKPRPPQIGKPYPLKLAKLPKANGGAFDKMGQP